MDKKNSHVQSHQHGLVPGTRGRILINSILQQVQVDILDSRTSDMSQAPRKRVKIDLRNSTYRDRLPAANNYNIIHSSEGTVRGKGSKAHSVRQHNTAERVPSAWETYSSWSPPDDNELALDENGTQYDNTVEANPMDERVEAVPVPKKRKKRSLVSVSVIQCFSFIFC